VSSSSPIEHQPEPAAFRRALAQFATGVTVISVRHGVDTHAMTANTFTSVSLDPPLVLFCVAKTARMARFVEEADTFAVSVLSAEQEGVSRHFAGSRKGSSDTAIDMVDGPVAPLVSGALVSLSCRIESVHPGGDHLIVVGRVIELHDPLVDGLERPLVFFRSRYCHVVERDLDVQRPGEIWTNDAIMIYHDEWSAGGEPETEERDSPW
jgi:flavin reductase (DIM6/NTAB) family NADH-FMN oxidoreductase RutF